MRVAIVARTAKRRGGTETYLFDLVRGFRTAGHTVDVFAGADSRDSPARAAGATMRVWPLGLVPTTIRPWALRAAVGAALRPAAYDLTISLARVNGQHLAICGGTHRGCLRATGQALGLRDRSEIALEERCYRESAMNVAHSRRMAAELVELYGVEPERVCVVYPPVDSSVYRPLAADRRQNLKRQFGFSPQATTILFPSTSHERKGLPLLVEAFAGLPAGQFELAVAGSKPSGAAGQAPIKSLGVKYLGFVRNMAELYHAVDVTALPAQYEPFGLVVPESIACGTPVVTAAHVGASEIMTPACGIVLPELSAPALREALLRVRRERFAIPADFVVRQGLDLAGHIARLIATRPALRLAA